MLGASFFHMLPEAVELGGVATVPAVLLGFLTLYLLERFVLIHICAEPAMNQALSTRTVHRAVMLDHEAPTTRWSNLTRSAIPNSVAVSRM